MTYVPIIAGRRCRRVAIAIGGAVAAAAALAALAGPAPTGGAALQELPPGRWETFANGNDVLALAARGRTLWAGTRGGGLVRWDLDSGTYRQFLRPQDPLADNTVADLAVDGSGRVWVATGSGLSMLDDAGTAATGDDTWRTYTRAGTYGGLPSDDVRAVAVDGSRIWVGGAQVWNPVAEKWEGGGLGRLDTAGTPATADDTWLPVATFESTLHEGPNGDMLLGLVSDNLTDIVVTPGGDLWISTAPHWRFEKPPVGDLPPAWTRVHGGISFLDTGATPGLSDDVWTASGCEAAQVTVTCQVQALALDRSGSMWAAIAGRGVMFWPVGEAPIIDEESRVIALPDGVEDDFVEAIAFGPAGDPALANTVWLARRKGGLSVLDHRGTLRRTSDDEWNLGHEGPLTVADGLAASRVQAVVVGQDHVYLGTGPEFGMAGGISRLEASSVQFAPALVTIDGPPTNFVTTIAVGARESRWDGHVWMGTGSRVQRRFGAGVVDLDTRRTSDRGDDTWTMHTAAATDPDGREPWAGLAGDNVHALVVQGDRIWTGSAEATWDQSRLRFVDGGLSVYDGSTWTSRTVDNTKVGGRPGLRHGSVSSLAAGCNGDVWVGTGNGWDFWGAGIDVLLPGPTVTARAGDTWTGYSYPTLAGANTTGIAVDCAGKRVWVSAEHHVTQGDPGTGTPGGDHVGGGVAVLDTTSSTWTRHNARTGLECYARSFVDCEATDVAIDEAGAAWVGTYGTRATETGALVAQHPYYPAVVNRRWGSSWSPRVFEAAGQVSSIVPAPGDLLYVGTTRDGTARQSPRPESWTVDRVRGGLLVYDGATWHVIDVATSGIVANDISDVALGPDGEIWVATEGWGIARYGVGEAPPTPTATSDAPSPTPSPTPTASRTPSPTTVATEGATGTVTTTVTPSTPGTPGTPGTPDGRRFRLALPLLQRPRR